MEEKKDRIVKVRCTEDQLESWSAKAKAADVSLSDLVRTHLDGAKFRRRRRVEVDPALLRELARIGNNLNQIARWANHRKSAGEAVQVIGRLAAIDEELSSLRRLIEAAPDAD